MNYVKDAIPEGDDQHQQIPEENTKTDSKDGEKPTAKQESTSTATDSLSSLFSGFLSSAISKTKNAIQEVLEEANAGEQES